MSNPVLYFASRLGSVILFTADIEMRNAVNIDYRDAKQALELIIEKARQMQKAVAVAVTDSHGELIAFARMDGVPLPSIVIAMNKACTAARTGKPTQEIGEKVRHPEKGHDISYYGDSRFVGWGGGVPVNINGEIAGAIGVSGLSSVEDSALATLGAELIARSSR
jgi:glc operon protein GlcG